jgi:hypothetical protein
MCICRSFSDIDSFTAFLEAIEKISDTLERGKITACSEHVHGLKNLFKNFANRTEATRDIIRSATGPGNIWEISVINGVSQAYLKYASGDRTITHDIDRLQDVRSRALIMGSNEQTEDKAREFVARVDELQVSYIQIIMQSYSGC